MVLYIPGVMKLVDHVHGELVSVAIVVLILSSWASLCHLSFDLWALACEVCILTLKGQCKPHGLVLFWENLVQNFYSPPSINVTPISVDPL